MNRADREAAILKYLGAYGPDFANNIAAYVLGEGLSGRELIGTLMSMSRRVLIDRIETKDPHNHNPVMWKIYGQDTEER